MTGFIVSVFSYGFGFSVFLFFIGFGLHLIETMTRYR